MLTFNTNYLFKIFRFYVSKNKDLILSILTSLCFSISISRALAAEALALELHPEGHLGAVLGLGHPCRTVPFTVHGSRRHFVICSSLLSSTREFSRIGSVDQKNHWVFPCFSCLFPVLTLRVFHRLSPAAAGMWPSTKLQMTCGDSPSVQVATESNRRQSSTHVQTSLWLRTMRECALMYINVY